MTWVLVAALLPVLGIAATAVLEEERADPPERPTRATFVVTGSIQSPTTDGAATPQRCAYGATGSQGVVGYTITSVTPGARFSVVAFGDRGETQDLDVFFYRRLTACPGSELAASPSHTNAYGDEAGWVPPNAVAAIVALHTGGNARFRYVEFPPHELPLVDLEVTDALRFREIPALDVTSTHSDLYEPHIVVSGTGAIYAAGHTAAADTHRSPAFVSLDDGASWRRLPDPEPLGAATVDVPGIGGRVGQGNEGGITADATGRAWLYDAAWIAGTSPLYGWCDDGARSCYFEPIAFDPVAHATRRCAEPPPDTLDKPWARYGNGKVLLSNVGLRTGLVDEYRTTSMLGLLDVETGERTWNSCVAVGGMPGIPAMRDSDGTFAIPQVARTAEGEGWLVVHSGASLDAISTSEPILPVHRSWQVCYLFNGYGTFSAAGTHFVFSGVDANTLAVSASRDLKTYSTAAFEGGGAIRYMWAEGSQLGDGALLTWAVGEDCNPRTPATFYAAHVTLGDEGPILSNVSVVVEDVAWTCGHYMGNDLGPDGRAYLIVHAGQSACLGSLVPDPPFTQAPWKLYVQDSGPTL